MTVIRCGVCMKGERWGGECIVHDGERWEKREVHSFEQGGWLGSLDGGCYTQKQKDT